jgi:uncharacterized protein (DUF1778 family)
MKTKVHDRKKQYRFSATSEEHAAIRRAANQSGLSVSRYVAAAALKQRPGVSAERLQEGIDVVEKVLARLHEIADQGGESADGLLVLRSLQRIERMVLMLTTDLMVHPQ